MSFMQRLGAHFGRHAIAYAIVLASISMIATLVLLAAAKTTETKTDEEAPYLDLIRAVPDDPVNTQQQQQLPVAVTSDPSNCGLGHAIVITNLTPNVLYGVKYRTFSAAASAPYVGWIPLLEPMLPGTYTRCDFGYGVNTGLPINIPQGDWVEVFVPGYDIYVFTW